MIERDEAQRIHDDLIRSLHKKLSQGACPTCGSTGVTAAEMNVLRQMLKDNEFQGIVAGSAVAPLRSVGALPFPQDRAAHSPDKPQAAAEG